MICIWIKSVQFQISFSFLAVWSLLLIINDTTFLISSFLACFLHEVGHLMAMLVLGQKIRTVSFYGMGIRICPEHMLYSFLSDILVLISGPAVNLITGGILYFLTGNIELSGLHIILGTFNLLPYRNLDGGAILHIILSYFIIDEKTVERIMLIICIIFSILVLIISIYNKIFNITFYAVLIYLIFSECFKIN